MRGRGIIFDGIQNTKVQVVELKVGRVAPVQRNTLLVEGRPGGVSQGYVIGVRSISAVVQFDSDSKEGWLEILDEVKSWLLAENPKTLEFEQERGRVYYAELEGTIDTKEINIYGQATINWICVDPYVYGNKNIDVFSEGIVTVNNIGHAETPPVFELDVLEDISHVDIVSDKDYIRLGEPAPIDVPVYERQTLILNDTMKTFIGWTDAVNVDNGYVTGSMAATQSGFEASDFGATQTPNKWQGPSKRRTLPEPVQNFRADIPVEMLNVTKETGMIEIYFLDAFSNVVAKIGIEDIWPTLKKNQTKFQLGNVEGRKVQKYRTADYAPAWNDFKGILRIYRDGNRFRPYFALVDRSGKHSWSSFNYVYTDKANEFSALITQVQVAIRKWPGKAGSEAKMKIGGIKVWRLNSPAEGIPAIAKAGDKIIIDSLESEVRVNGEIREDLKDHFSNFFDLPKGKTTLLMLPSESLTGTVTYRERSL